MAEDNVMVASAVIIPEAAEESAVPTSTGATKRRQSSISQPDGDANNSSKRPRLSSYSETHHQSEDAPDAEGSPTHPPPASATEATDEQLPTGPNGTSGARRNKAGMEPQSKDEERKRGRRLFGSLLGTLSQSSSTSTKQKRRADIDRKQQEKLKQQDEEYDEERRKQFDETVAARREQQVVWDEESMHLRHANMLAVAHSLKTTSQPVLYFKPWELSTEEKERINAQIQEAEGQIEKELEEHNKRNPTREQPALERAQVDGAAEADTAADPQVSEDMVTNDNDELSADAKAADEAPATSTENSGHDKAIDQAEDEGTKDAVDDNEEVVVDAGEDAVIW